MNEEFVTLVNSTITEKEAYDSLDVWRKRFPSDEWSSEVRIQEMESGMWRVGATFIKRQGNLVFDEMRFDDFPFEDMPVSEDYAVPKEYIDNA